MLRIDLKEDKINILNKYLVSNLQPELSKSEFHEEIISLQHIMYYRQRHNNGL